MNIQNKLENLIFTQPFLFLLDFLVAPILLVILLPLFVIVETILVLVVSANRILTLSLNKLYQRVDPVPVRESIPSGDRVKTASTLINWFRQSQSNQNPTSQAKKTDSTHGSKGRPYPATRIY